MQALTVRPLARTAPITCAAASAVGTAAAIAVLPWTYYGAFEMLLFRFPGWGWYVAVAVLFHAALLWRLFGPARRVGLVAAILAGLATITAAVLVASEYDDPSNFFDGIYPAVFPTIGPGVHVAVAAVLVGIVGVSWRAGCSPSR